MRGGLELPLWWAGEGRCRRWTMNSESRANGSLRQRVTNSLWVRHKFVTGPARASNALKNISFRNFPGIPSASYTSHFGAGLVSHPRRAPHPTRPVRGGVSGTMRRRTGSLQCGVCPSRAKDRKPGEKRSEGPFRATVSGSFLGVPARLRHERKGEPCDDVPCVPLPESFTRPPFVTALATGPVCGMGVRHGRADGMQARDGESAVSLREVVSPRDLARRGAAAARLTNSCPRRRRIGESTRHLPRISLRRWPADPGSPGAV
jgi:hypothetical protein